MWSDRRSTSTYVKLYYYHSSVCYSFWRRIHALYFNCCPLIHYQMPTEVFHGWKSWSFWCQMYTKYIEETENCHYIFFFFSHPSDPETNSPTDFVTRGFNNGQKDPGSGSWSGGWSRVHKMTRPLVRSATWLRVGKKKKNTELTQN